MLKIKTILILAVICFALVQSRRYGEGNPVATCLHYIWEANLSFLQGTIDVLNPKTRQDGLEEIFDASTWASSAVESCVDLLKPIFKTTSKIT